MSNLNSIFDTPRGWPDSSALEKSFVPDPNVASIAEGKIVKVEGRELDGALVLKMVDDGNGGPPTLAAGDAGNAYEVDVASGAWSGFAVGDIVEWDGTAWNLIIANSGGNPPDGTRVVVTDTGAANSFAGEEEKTMACTTGTWAVVDTPVNGNRILIDSAASIYSGNYYDYAGTHPTGAWGIAENQVPLPAVVSLLTSGAQASTPKDDAWLVIQGNDQWDAQFAGSVTCLKLASGCAFKIQHDDADTLVAGTFVEASAGVLQAVTTLWPIGQVIYSNGVAGSSGYIVVATY
jgi:hypothetical protein